jgi:predicted GTPase
MVFISDELADFIGVQRGSSIKPVQAIMFIHKYISENNLKDKVFSNGRNINPDAKLKSILTILPGEILTHFNLHRYMRHNFHTKLNTEIINLSSQQTTPASYSKPLQTETKPDNQNEQTSKMSAMSITKKLVTKSVTIEKPQPQIQQSPQSTIPVDNINICIVGGVSTGKSTFLNAIFCENLSECKIKRTTMVPTVYIENEIGASNIEKPEQILAKIEQKNKEIIEKTESGTKVSDQEYTELQFNVGKLDINILPDSYVNVYDIPGLNDARTKEVYYDYLRRNFFKFNLIIFLVDIHSGLNTSDEADILQFIANHTREQLDKNQKKIYTLVIVNKADDMQLKEGGKNGELEIVGELDDMFKQVDNAVRSEFKAKNITDHLVGDGVIPLCAIDSYLYRMTRNHGDSFKLSAEQILKIGINEQGKKFSKLTKDVQESKVRKMLNNETFVNDMITLSGFGRFEKLLAEFLEKNDTGKGIRIDNLLYELRKHPKIGAYILANPTNMEGIVGLCHDIFKIFNAILKIDKETGDQYIAATLFGIEDALQKYLEPWIMRSTIQDLESVMAYYTQFRYAVFVPYFDKHRDSDNSNLKKNDEGVLRRDWSVYPEYIQKLVHSRICILLGTVIIQPGVILSALEMCKMIGTVSKPKFKSLVDSVLGNVNKYSTISQTKDLTADNANIIAFVKAGEKLGVDMTTFFRFVLLNRISDSRNISERILFQKQMIYLQRGEVPIYSYLLYVNQGRRVLPEWVVDGVTDSMMSDVEHALDLEYLARIK